MDRQFDDGRHDAVPAEAGEVMVVRIVNTILRNWRLILVLPIVVALAVGAWTVSQERRYAATASFLPQSAEGRGVSGAAALAQQLGVNLGADRSSVSPQFYLDLLGSQAVLRAAVESEYRVRAAGGGERRASLIEIYGVSETPSVPAWRAAMAELRENINASFAFETGVVRFKVEGTDPALTEQIAARLLELLDRFNTDVRQSRAREEGRFIGGRLEEARAELLAVEGSLQEFLRQNREFRNSPELLFEHDRLQRQVAMRQEIYTSLLRSEEQARIDAVRDTPLFTVIDHPAGTAEPQGRGTIMRVLVGFVFGFLLALLLATLREYIRRTRQADDPQYRELQGLAHQTLDDLRHPSRWLRRSDKPVAAGGDS